MILLTAETIERYNQYALDNKDAFIKKWFPESAFLPETDTVPEYYYISAEQSLVSLKAVLEVVIADDQEVTLKTVINTCDYIAWYDKGPELPEEEEDGE